MTPENSTKGSLLTSYLFLHAESPVVISLDGICNIPHAGTFVPAGAGFRMCPLLDSLTRSTLSLAYEYEEQFCAAVQTTLELTRKRVGQEKWTQVEDPGEEQPESSQSGSNGSKCRRKV